MDFDISKTLNTFSKNPYLSIKLLFFAGASYFLIQSSLSGFTQVFSDDIFIGIIYQIGIVGGLMLLGIISFFICKSLYNKYVKNTNESDFIN